MKFSGVPEWQVSNVNLPDFVVDQRIETAILMKVVGDERRFRSTASSSTYPRAHDSARAACPPTRRKPIELAATGFISARRPKAAVSSSFEHLMQVASSMIVPIRSWAEAWLIRRDAFLQSWGTRFLGPRKRYSLLLKKLNRLGNHSSSCIA